MAKKKDDWKPAMTGTPSEATKLLQVEILALRRQKMSFPSIAQHFGMTQGYIYKLYKKALKDIIHESVDETRKLELEALNDLEAKLLRILGSFHPLVAGGGVVRDILEDASGKPVLDEDGNPITVKVEDQGPILATADKILKVMERRAKLLGLDAPTKTALTNPAGDKEASYVQFYLPSNSREDEAE